MADQDANMNEAQENILEQTLAPFSHSTLMIVRASQNQNGLRHNDYARYHQYCVRKCHRLRKAVKLLQQSGNKSKTRQKFTKLIVSGDQAKRGEKFLEILLFRIEADWAYAMDMKRTISQQEGGQVPVEESKAGIKNQSLFNQKGVHAARNSSRLKLHARKRMQRVFMNCSQLAKVAQECLDGFAKFEVQAYAESMQAVYLIEVEKYQAALDLLLNSKAIYQKLTSYKDSIEAVLYQEKLSQIDTFVRLCCAKLAQVSTQKIESNFEATKKKLQDEIAQAQAQTKQEQIENLEKIQVGTKSIPLKSERLRATFKKVETQADIVKQLEQEGKDATSAADLIKAYLKLADILEDAQLVIKKERTEEQKKSEQGSQVYSLLISYLQKLKLKTAVDRNLLQAAQMASKLTGEQIFSRDRQQVRAQNIIRFYEKAQKAQQQLVTVERELLGTGGEADALQILQAEFEEKQQEAQVSYFCAVHYLQEETGSLALKKGLMVLQACTFQIQDAIEFAQKNSLKSQKTLGLVKDLEQNLAKKVDYAICKCNAKLLSLQADRIRAIKTVQSSDVKKLQARRVEFDNFLEVFFDSWGQRKFGAGDLVQIESSGDVLNVMEGQSDVRVKSFAQRRLDQNEQTEQQTETDISKLKVSKQFKLAQSLPKLQSVSATPQFFDIAGGYLSYSAHDLDLQAQPKKYEASGISFLKSWF